MWISFTAERDSRVRLDRGKRAFAVDGDLDRLLRNHWLVFMTVLFRLEILVVMGIVTAVWGLGPRVAVWFVLLAGLMMLLTWPSEHKTRLLIFRAKESD
jgi:Flp pilus assembly protein TadB